MARLNSRGKIVFTVLAVVAVVFGLRAAMSKGLIPTPGIMKTVVASKVDLPNQADAQVSGVKPLPFPSSSKAEVASTRIPFDIWEWNAMFGLLYANGGSETTKGSLMQKYGVNLAFKRTDSNSDMKSDLLACAKQLHDGEKTCSTGAVAIVVMGDGAGQWLADLNPQLKKLGPEYQLAVLGAVGRSNGEDALMGPASWKSDPKTMKGGTVVGVLRDGDWNIALNFMGSNGLKNNPDPKTYDPDAVNWIGAPNDDYIKAVTEVFVPNRCEPRKVVKDGRPTGEVKSTCPDAVVTWYPGDRLALEGRSGTVKIVSSREYASQMPSVIIGIKKFFNDNREQASGLLAAVFEASDQIKAFPDARKKAAEISAAVYKDQNTDYWYKAYEGYSQAGVALGGSAVFNLEDNVNYFGLDNKHNNNMRATYETFGKIATEQYPELFKNNPIPPYKEVVDTSFIFGAQSKFSNEGVQSASAETVDYKKEAASGNVVGKAAVYIPFNTGSDEPTFEGVHELSKLKDALAINSKLAIAIDGYTDNTGSDQTNIPLSERRALAVKNYFQKVAPLSFPEDRFKAVQGHGSQNPIAPNTTVSNKALNRRVEISQIGSN